MAAYTESIESIIEIDQIQKLHDACLLDITKLLFIKNTYVSLYCQYFCKEFWQFYWSNVHQIIFHVDCQPSKWSSGYCP